MRSIMLVLVLTLISAGLMARGEDAAPTAEAAAAEAPGEASAEEPGGAPGEASTEEPEEAPDAPVSVVRGDDRFLPTERLRYDQEVDYPTDI